MAGTQRAHQLEPEPNGRRLLSVVTAPAGIVDDRAAGWYEHWGKRAFDVVVSASLLLLALPVMAIVWAALRVTLGRDVVITQDRVGRGGQAFGMYKFRTMHWSRRGTSAPFDGPDRRVAHKADHDPRHTPVGRALRKASLDELPQLMNVLKGDMSLVGPRPELVSVVDGIGQRGHARHSVRPGMTGAWQVSVRQQGVPLHECFDHDLPYLEHVTFGTDLGILVKTVGVVLGRGGR
jgi:lipopolysaccharide/colanic/teichoic acid biosynthesis glycosyltransferase